jgi:hypothetical protein
MVKAENTYGNIAPIKRPAKTSGLVNEMSFPPSRSALCKNPPKSDSETRAADPIANPFPIAAVVLPAASSPSVLSLTYSPISAISAIPPALSEIGP